MEMGQLEKLFVNGASHSKTVGQRAVQRLQSLPVKPDQLYLDVGCGNGEAAIYIAQRFPINVTGVDIDAEQIQLARAKGHGIGNVHFEVADSLRLAFGNAEFDIVASNKLTHHIPCWQDALSEMIRVLKPGGYLIYADLVFPEIVARFGEAVAKNLGGFPTRQALNRFIKTHHLVVVNRSQSPVSFDGVFQKEI